MKIEDVNGTTNDWANGDDPFQAEQNQSPQGQEGNVESYNTFEEMGLDENILYAIYQYGFEKPSPIQRLAIKPIVAGRDIIAQAQAGTGKTGAFTLSVLQRVDPTLPRTQAIVLVPTRVLADMHLEFMSAMGARRKVTVSRCIGGTSLRDDENAIRNGAQIVLGTPGRILGLILSRILNLDDVKVLVFDEADELLRDGPDGGFKEQMYNIVSHMPEEVQIALFSATFSDVILEVTKKFMRNPVKILVEPEKITMRHIKQYYIPLEDSWKLETLMDLYDTISVSQSIIFVNTITRLEYIRVEMMTRDFAVACYHAELSMEERSDVLQNFRKGLSRVLISTDVLKRGVDIETVSLVVNYDIPRHKEDYIHRIGRCGRASKKGMAINFVTQRDARELREIENYFQVNVDVLPQDISDIL